MFISGAYTLLFLGVGGSPGSSDKPTVIDWTLSLLSLVAGAYFFLHAQEIQDRISLLDPFTDAQLFFGTSLLMLTLEASRRTTGLGLTGVVVFFLIYNLFGYLLPPPFGHGVSTFPYLLDVLVFTMDGIFGVPIEVAASYVFLFVLFGTLLSKAGGGEFFFNLAASLTGKSPGGPAKVAILSSGLYGTMSGSPTSDVVATGSITIPIMRKLGYQRSLLGQLSRCVNGGSACRCHGLLLHHHGRVHGYALSRHCLGRDHSSAALLFRCLSASSSSLSSVQPSSIRRGGPSSFQNIKRRLAVPAPHSGHHRHTVGGLFAHLHRGRRHIDRCIGQHADQAHTHVCLESR